MRYIEQFVHRVEQRIIIAFQQPSNDKIRALLHCFGSCIPLYSFGDIIDHRKRSAVIVVQIQDQLLFWDITADVKKAKNGLLANVSKSLLISFIDFFAYFSYGTQNSFDKMRNNGS